MPSIYPLISGSSSAGTAKIVVNEHKQIMKKAYSSQSIICGIILRQLKEFEHGDYDVFVFATAVA